MATQKLQPGLENDDAPLHSTSAGAQNEPSVLPLAPAVDRRDALPDLDYDYDRQITEEEM